MKRFFLLLGAVLVLALGLVFWWRLSLSPANSSDSSIKTFVVARGDGVREIARKLRDEGLIRNQVAFFLLVKSLGIEKNIQAGSFKLSPAMTAAQLAKKLTVGTEDIWITIPEGWRSEQIVEYLTSKEIRSPDSDLQAVFSVWKKEEGQYFPETYLVPKLITLDGVRKLMRQTFDEKTVGQSVDDKTLILASLVEREAKKEEDRPLVASVLKNRLKIGMKLDIDATVQYAVGFTQKDGWWKKDLTIDDLAVRSPYNTYTNPGLPPTPICNPGLSVIRAVLNPAETDYLYYLTDKDGLMHYSSTIDQHNANVLKYL